MAAAAAVVCAFPFASFYTLNLRAVYQPRESCDQNAPPIINGRMFSVGIAFHTRPAVYRALGTAGFCHADAPPRTVAIDRRFLSARCSDGNRSVSLHRHDRLRRRFRPSIRVNWCSSNTHTRHHTTSAHYNSFMPVKR